VVLDLHCSSIQLCASYDYHELALLLLLLQARWHAVSCWSVPQRHLHPRPDLPSQPRPVPGEMRQSSICISQLICL
jgi:hypothetical protein